MIAGNLWRETVLALSTLLAIASSIAHAGYQIPQSVIASGGGTSAAGTYAITGTIGQGTTAYSTGGTYSIGSGFWGAAAGTGGFSDITINVTINGSGTGVVASSPAGINCPGSCGFLFNGVASVALDATPANANSVFTGWLGACTGRSTCVINAAGTQNLTATFAPDNGFALLLDADENNSADALTDGVIIVRYMLGVSGAGLNLNAVAPNALLVDPGAVKQHLDDIRPLLDIDGNGQVDALSDGLMLMRYLFGLRGDALTADAIGSGARRATFGPVQSYIQPLLP